MIEQQARETERIDYLDGLRGFAALAVLLCHALLIFSEPLATLTQHGGFGRLPAFSIKVMGLLFNGNSSVCIFFLLSGYVMAGFARNSKLSLPAQIVRRYLRLALPILATSTCAYLLLRFGLLRNTESARIFGGWAGLWYQFDPSGSRMLYEALVGTFINGSNAYNPNLWTMHPELVGSLYVLLIGAIRSRRWRTALYACFMAYYVFDYLPLFAVGALLYDYDSALRRLVGAAWVPISMFVFGFYLATLPELSTSGELINRLYPLPQFSWDNSRYWHSIGAVLMLIGLLGSPMLQRPLGLSLGRFLGRISFTLYLIHVPIYCSLGAWLIVELAPSGHVIAAAIGLPISIVACLTAAALLSPIVDGSAIVASRKIGRWLDQMIASAIYAARIAVGASIASTTARAVVVAPDSTHAASSASAAKQDYT